MKKISLILLISLITTLALEMPLGFLSSNQNQKLAEANEALNVDHVPQELILTVNNANKDTLKKVLLNLKKDYDLEEVESLNSPENDTFNLTFAADQDLAFIIASETADFELEPNYLVQAASLPTDTHYTTEQWYLKNTGQSYHTSSTSTTQGVPGIDINWQPVFENSNLRGSGVTVAVIDSGINTAHPDLQSNLWVNPGELLDNADNDGNGLLNDINGWNFVNDDNVLTDELGHGTNAAGLIAAVANTRGVIGIAPQAKIMTLKVLDSNGNGSTADVVQAMNYAINKGVKVINMSFGGVNASTTAVTQACANAEAQGIVLVAAAGNTNQDIVSSNFGPANLPTVIAVGSIDNQGNKATFSNTGNKLELVTPGVALLSPRAGNNNEQAAFILADGSVLPDGYIIRSGTSFSTPMVSGAAALLLQQNPNLNVSQVRSRLQVTATDLGLPGKDTQFGYGLLNVASALNVPTVLNQPPQILTANLSANPIQNDNVSSTNLTVTTSDPDGTQDIVSVTANLTSLGKGITTLTSQGNGTYVSGPITTLAAAGSYSVTIIATDTQNHTATTSVSLQISELPSQISITSPTTETTFQTSTSSVTLSGTTSGPIAKILINDVVVSSFVLGNTTWNQSLNVPEGTTVYNVNAYNSLNQLVAADSIVITKTTTIVTPTTEPTSESSTRRRHRRHRSSSSSTMAEIPTITFVDIPTTHFAYTQIQDLAFKGAISGYTTSAGVLFLPNNSITRGEFLKIAMRDAGLSQEDCTNSAHFADTQNSVFKQDIACAVAHNIVADGFANFNPNIPVSRAEAVIWLVRIRGTPLVSGSSFSDITDPTVASYVEAARLKGWLSGQNGLFYPFNKLTRAEAAKLIVNSRF